MTGSNIEPGRTCLVVVDVQVKLMAVMGRRDRTLEGLIKLGHLARTFELPLILTEQHPRWLGPTLPEVRTVLPDVPAIEKLDFDCCALPAFNRALDMAGAENVILTGVETHICVLQTGLSLIEKGYRVHVPVDAVDSRTGQNRRVGLGLLHDAGAVVTSAETIIFQLLKRAGTERFKTMMKVVK